MKLLLLAGTACLGLATSVALAASPVVFTYTGSLVTFAVPATGPYQILAFGAQGGDYTVSNVTGRGGLGAEIGGDFNLTAGELLQIAVGGVGTSQIAVSGVGSPGTAIAGGGGGSFVVGPSNTPLVIAGGGGGGGYDASSPQALGLPGGGGLTGPDGGSTGGAGGTNGNGGAAGLNILEGSSGGGGGGLLSAGENAQPNGGTGGGAFPSLAGGTPGGGFGGGGGGPAGGGGGYSGGSGGGFHNVYRPYPGGGGGSFDAGTNQTLVANFWIGFGQVVISPVFAGTPGKASCHGQTVSALAQQYGGLGDAAVALGYASVGALQNAISGYCAG